VKAKTVESFLDALEPAQRETVNILRGLALGASQDVAEHIKWNAPSFTVGGDDRITLGIDRAGAVRVILHRGVKVKDSSGFHFHDTTGRVAWAAADRGVITFSGPADIKSAANDVGNLFRSWLAATA
jgi:hypothetical protein